MQVACKTNACQGVRKLELFQFWFEFTKKEPPNADPRQTRPVTSWNGRVEISWPAAATPMMTDSPQPLWQASRAALWNTDTAQQVSLFQHRHTYRQLTNSQSSSHFFKRCFTFTETVRTMRDRELRAATMTFTQLPSSDHLPVPSANSQATLGLWEKHKSLKTPQLTW